MDNTLLISLSQQLAAYQSMDVIANNLANVNTPAFKRESMKFQEAMETVPPAEGQTGPQTISFVQDAGAVRDLSEGQIQTTGASFDLAVNGTGYFVVQTANGDRYTRDGHFQLDSQGELATSNGDPVMGEGGAISITTDDGNVHIAPDGTVSGQQGQIGKIRLVTFPDERALTKEGASLYSTTQSPTQADGQIHQGALETSNVQPVIEISHMLEVMRAYQATANLTESEQNEQLQAIDKLGSVVS